MASTPKPIQFRQSLFWDVDPATIDPQKNAQYIIERILDFGNDEELRWLVHFYSPEQIATVVKTSRVLHAKSRALWSLLYR